MSTHNRRCTDCYAECANVSGAALTNALGCRRTVSVCAVLNRAKRGRFAYFALKLALMYEICPCRRAGLRARKQCYESAFRSEQFLRFSRSVLTVYALESLKSKTHSRLVKFFRMVLLFKDSIGGTEETKMATF